MKYTDQALDLLENTEIAQRWPLLAEIINSARKINHSSWELPIVSCAAFGGTPAQTVPAIAAVASLQLSIILIDDLLDEDPHGKHHEVGVGQAANLASAFHMLGLDIVQSSTLTEQRKFYLVTKLNQMMGHTAYGQALDIENPHSEEAYWRMARAKSSPFYSTSLLIGAAFAGASEKIIEQVEEFGIIYGEMIQIHDDLKDSLITPANPDWMQGRYSLPLLYADIVPHPEQAEFRKLRTVIMRGENGEALAEAQDILVRSGAISYGLDQLVNRYQEGLRLLANIPMEEDQRMSDLLEEMVDPLRELLVNAAIEIPQAIAG